MAELTLFTASADLPDWQRTLLCDPQTSGGLLVAASPGAAGTLLDRLRAAGWTAAVIGETGAGPAGVTVA